MAVPAILHPGAIRGVRLAARDLVDALVIGARMPAVLAPTRASLLAVAPDPAVILAVRALVVLEESTSVLPLRIGYD